jgi:hypothetical protein
VGRLPVRWFPGLARLTTAMAALYFVLAVAFHIRARDHHIIRHIRSRARRIFGVVT